MGLLTVGTPLNWSEIKQFSDLIKRKGIKQFLNIYNRYKTHENDSLKWGDEIEFSILKFDHENRKVYLSLSADKLLPILQEPENTGQNAETLWRPEYANYMVEGTPGRPYDDSIRNFLLVQKNMQLRRKQVQDLLDKDEYCLSLTSYPMLGCKNFTWPICDPTPTLGITRSLFFPDQAIYLAHPRFASLSQNIRERRKSKVCINVPIYEDMNTELPFIEDLVQYGDVDNESSSVRQPNHIYMDAMGFGMGCSCLQMTFQAQSIDEARHLYDQLTPLTPIMLALSASSPIWRGYLADIDCRWNVICSSVDDRTAEERGEKPLNENRLVISKSRYDSIDCYLSANSVTYNDIPVVKNDEAYATLKANGIDDLLAQHIAHLFIRDPVSLFKEKIDIDDATETDHFENIQSTNWQNMRFKPPPINAPIGWRVEFRPIELQITDFENAAFVTFLVLITRAVLSYKLNLLIPISKVDENMQTAQKRDACRLEKFFFRKSIFTKPKMDETTSSNDVLTGTDKNTQENVIELMSINEIINGKDEFPGLLQLIRDYLNNIDVDVETQCAIKQYLRFIEYRAKGRLLTPATWMRDFVLNHPEYKNDSRITDGIAYDLTWNMYQLSSGEKHCPKLLPAMENNTWTVKT
jgi:glutamate--cysteine ligase catalytic subunit